MIEQEPCLLCEYPCLQRCKHTYDRFCDRRDVELRDRTCVSRLRPGSHWMQRPRCVHIIACCVASADARFARTPRLNA